LELEAGGGGRGIQGLLSVKILKFKPWHFAISSDFGVTVLEVLVSFHPNI
jgi:hypothetical protein